MNVWTWRIACLLAGAVLVLAAPAAQAADEEGFVSLFDGKSLDGWDGNPEIWRVEDGAIVGQTTPETNLKQNTFIVWRGGEVADFVLRFEYRLTGGNSGMQYRSFEKPDEWGRWVIGGYQGDIEAGDNYSGILYGERFRGILCLRGDKTVIGDDHKPKVVGKIGDSKQLQQAVKKEDWNSYEITAQGFHFTHSINGQLMIDCTDEDTAQRRASGLLAMQVHVGPPMKVEFRNIRLKRLEPAADAQAAAPAGKKVVFLAGGKSHGYAGHEHLAGCKLLARLLEEGMPQVETAVYQGWPSQPGALDDADTIVVFCDGGGGHLALAHLDELAELMKRKVGLVMLHYAVEVPKERAGPQFLDWVGGYFETYWSINPHWNAQFTEFPDHPVARGLKPFGLDDEWYYHMRFRENMEGVTPILTAIPPDETRRRADGAHSGNPAVRARMGMPEHLAWACERADGGRGFGFTGGHWHWNWGNPSFTRAALNGIVWTAGLEVPADGVPLPEITLADLEANQDFDQPQGFDRARIEKQLEEWQR